MNSERWQQIEAIYHSALEVESVNRDDFLAVACAGDESLRHEVISLLSSAERTDSFMEESGLSLGLSLMGVEPESLAGKMVGRYKLLELLGRGGMGEVYLAHDPRLDRRVALKLLPPEIEGDEERIRRFEHEARVASSISHPNVAHIYEIGAEQGRLYITMEYIRGRTLRQTLKQGLMDVGQALDVAAQIAAALAAAHEVGVIHRDIKPENVMLHTDGYVKVLDFGLAKLVENRPYSSESETTPLPSLHTGPELLMGTPDYMSPEQVRRLPPDKRTDLWSLGVVLYEMLAGHRPFRGQEPSEIIVAILERQPEPLGNIRPELPTALQEVASKALLKSPEDRYQSAQIMAAEVRRVRRLIDQSEPLPAPDEHNFADYPPPLREPAQPDSTTTEPLAGKTNELSRPYGAPERMPEFAPNEVHSTRLFIFQRRWQPLQWLILLLLVSTGLYFGFVRQRHRALQNSDLNLRFERLNLSGDISDIILSPDGKYVASIITEEGKQTIHITELATASDLRVVTPSAGGYSGLSFSPDGTYLYYLENQAETGALYRVSKLGGGQRKILNNVNTLATFSPDGSRMAFMRLNKPTEPADLIVAQSDGTSERVLVRRMPTDSDRFFADMKGAAGPAWSADGKLLACPTRNRSLDNSESNVEVIDPQTGEGHRLNTRPWYSISGVAWLADGSGLVVAAKESPTAPWQLALLSYPDGEIRQLTKDPNNYTRISGTTDSSVFLTLNVEDDSNVWLASTEEGERFAPQIVSTKKGVSEVCWKPDGKLLYVVYDGINSNLWTAETDGSAARQLTFEANVNYRPVVTPDQRYIVFASTRAGATNIWRLDADGTRLKQLTSGSYEDMPSITPDGEWVIYYAGGSVRKVSINGGNSSELFNKSGLNPVASPDGRLLAFFASDRLDSKKWHLEVLDLRTLAIAQRFELPEATDPFYSLRWTPEGDGLTYISNANAASNIWLQPLSGASPGPLTDFREAEIQSFSWSRDGKRIACVRRAKTYIPMLVRPF